MSTVSEKHGLGVLAATVLIAGEMAGSGVLALPRAVVDAGWFGLVVIVILCVNSAYGGTRLGKCWEILEEKYPEFKGSSRDPYPAIAEKAMGSFGRYVITISNQLGLFGVGIVFLILASTIVEQLLKEYLPNITFCVWILIFAAAMTPPMWLGSPKDFWFVGVGALVTTLLACILIFTKIVIEGENKAEPTIYKQHNFMDFFLAFGVILFAFGGAATFPTIQNDMADRRKFNLCVCIGNIIILMIYMPVSIVGYLVYGENTNENIILSLDNNNNASLITVANLLIAIHLTMAFLIITNPASQEIENFFNISPKLNIKRCLIRTGLMCLMVFIAESIPKFGVILSLIGATTVSLTTFILPNLFYIILCNQETKEFPRKHIPWYFKLYMYLLIAIGVIGGIASTYSAIKTLTSANFVKPCYCS